jgi:hypothetical protein
MGLVGIIAAGLMVVVGADIIAQGYMAGGILAMVAGGLVAYAIVKDYQEKSQESNGQRTSQIRDC